MLHDNQYSSLNYYQNANGDAESIKTAFLIRQKEYGIILEDLRRNRQQHSVQHFLVLGRRGSGKSTLLKRLQVEIDTDAKLQKAYIAINLAEEQANIYRLFDLLEEILRELEARGQEVTWPAQEKDLHAYCRSLFQVIHTVTEKTGRQLVLLLDNIDRIFENLQEDTALLREFLQNHSDIKIIGGSTRMTEHFWKYNQPFYEFFRVLELKPLSSKDVKKLLLSWSDTLQAPVLREFVENRPGQLEAVRMLTDGLPRTLQFFVNILLTNEQETGYDYLRFLMDKVTPLYQERLNNLPPSQRKIVLQLAFCWEAVGAGDLAEACRMENRVVSAQLSQLIEKGVADKIDTGKKNHLYRLSERFFNLWLIFTQGNPREKRRARYLSVFLENFYDEKELKEKAEQHYDALQEGKLDPAKAVMLTKAFSQSKYISWWMRDVLISNTLYFPGMREELKSELPEMVEAIAGKILDLLALGNWEKAFDLIGSIDQEDGVKERLQGITFQAMRDIKKAEDAFLSSIDKGHYWAVADLGSLYLINGRFNLAEEYFKQGTVYDLDSCYSNLASMYYYLNIKPRDGYDVLEDGMNNLKCKEFFHLLAVLQAWNGQFDKLEDCAAEAIRKNENGVSFMLKHLLIHHQVNLVSKLFASEEFGPQLQEKYLALYYAAQSLLPDSKMTTLKIPPEILDLVNEIQIEIYSKRNFYYNQPAEYAAIKSK